jgi:hypothetical protein
VIIFGSLLVLILGIVAGWIIRRDTLEQWKYRPGGKEERFSRC